MGWTSRLASSFIVWWCSHALARAEDGFLTFYGPSTGVFSTDNGACGFGSLDSASWPYGRFVSLGANNSLTQAIGSNNLACGQCIEAVCLGDGCLANATSTILYVTDTCDCANNQLTVPRDVFLTYFGESAALGQVNITYNQVDCQPPDNIVVRVLASRADDGTYIAFVLLNVAGNGGILGVDLRSSSDPEWRPVANSYGNVWEASNIGDAPFDLRISTFNKPPLVIEAAIPGYESGSYPTALQFPNDTTAASSNAPAALNPPIAPPTVSPIRSPGPSSLLTPPDTAASPAQDSVVFTTRELPSIDIVGVRIDVPLYYAPVDSSTLGGYLNIKFAFTDCTPIRASVNLTIDRLQALDGETGGTRAWSLQAVKFRPVVEANGTLIYLLEDSTFFNLETGSLAQLFQPVYVSFSNPLYDGSSIPVQVPDTDQTVFPTYLNASAVPSPGNLSYTLLLPPDRDEAATDAYLAGLSSMFYYFTTLTLGNNGSPTTEPTCGRGYPATGPWADYLRVVLGQLAPPADVVGDYYNGVPLGQSFAFQGRSFVINNAVIAGEIVNTTSQLSAGDCGTQCRTDAANNSDVRTWSWCGSIAGCGTARYQACDLKASTAAQNSTGPDGFLNFNHSSSVRSTSGSLILPPPTGINTLSTTLAESSVQTSSGPSAEG